MLDRQIEKLKKEAGGYNNPRKEESGRSQEQESSTIKQLRGNWRETIYIWVFSQSNSERF